MRAVLVIRGGRLALKAKDSPPTPIRKNFMNKKTELKMIALFWTVVVSGVLVAVLWL